MSGLSHLLRQPIPYLLIILIGTGFKVSQIGQGFFWGDEIATIFHTNGQDATNFYDDLQSNVIRPASYYTDQLRLSNRADNRFGEQLLRLARKPQFTPLHYAYLMVWYRVFGEEPIAYRWFTFFCYLLALISLFFLGQELFRSSLGGWATAALFSVSPFFHFYSITARYYMLFILACLIAHLFLLFALRKGKTFSWAMYGIALAHVLYVSFLGLLILAGHLIFIFWKHRAEIKPFLLTSGLALLAYTPWLILLGTHFEEMYEAMEWHKAGAFTFPEMFIWQMAGVSSVFVDLKGEFLTGLFIRSWTTPVKGQLIVTAVLTVLAFGYLLFFLWKKDEGRVKGLLIPLLCLGSLFLFWSDVFRKTFISAIPHYHLPMLQAVILLAAWFFTRKIMQGSKVVSFIFLGIICLGIFSIYQQSGNRCVSNGGDCEEHLAKARIFEEPGSKLFVTSLDRNYVGEYILSMLNEAKADRLDILTITGNSDILSLIPPNVYDAVYLYEIGPDMEKSLKEQAGTTLEAKMEGMFGTLWELDQK